VNFCQQKVHLCGHRVHLTWTPSTPHVDTEYTSRGHEVHLTWTPSTPMRPKSPET